MKRGILGLLIVLSLLSWAQRSDAQANNPLTQISFAPLVEQTVDKVVSITAQKIVTRTLPTLFNDQFFGKFFGRDSFPNNRTTEAITHALGSGVVVNAAGLVVTSYHVIEGADKIQIQFNDRTTYDADVQMSDPSMDIAILRINSKKHVRFSPMPIGNSDDLAVGDLVLAIGNPYHLGQTVTTGIVSALARTLPQFSSYSSFIQTDAGINPGNSGGALINTKGELIGINTAIFSSSGGYQGIGFAIPSIIVLRAIEAAVDGRPFLKPWFGITGENINAEHVQTFNLEKPTGVLVKAVLPNSPAHAAKVQKQDIILSLDGTPINDLDHLIHRFATYRSGFKVPLTLLRNRKHYQTYIISSLPPLDPPPNYWHGKHYLSGATFVNLSPGIAQQLSLPEYFRGVATLVANDNTAVDQIGLKQGDILVSLNEQQIDSTVKLSTLVKRHARGRILLEFIRENKQRRVVIALP